MTRVAHNRLLRRLPYLLLIAGTVISLTHVTSGRKAPSVTMSPNPSVEGQWDLSFSAPHAMSHAAVLPNGKVLYWTAVAGPPTESRLWNCVINNGLCDLDVSGINSESIPYSTTDLFCSGHSLLPDGRLFVAGGSLFGGVGTPATTIFTLSPAPSPTPPATSGPNMAKGRWYPSTVTLGNGETSILSGTHCASNPPTANCSPLPFNRVPEVLNSAGTTLRTLSTAEEALSEAVWYPWLHLASDGRVFRAGPLSPSRWLDTSGTGAWSTTTKAHANAGTVPYRDFGASVMYDVDKVLIAGGGQNPGPTNTSEIINLASGTPIWTNTNAPMAFARRHLDLTILADGKVLATGGTSGNGFNDTCSSNAVLPAEIWDPANENWTTVASLNRRRQYHSVAVLLIDGRVLVGGTTFAPASDVTCKDLDEELQQEIFSPPYLFNSDGSPASRPGITSAPETISYGTQFIVGSPSASRITKITMVRLSSVTHSTNMNQRFNNLTFSKVGMGLLVTPPANGNQAPPGHYMLFIINDAGVPSVATVVKIH